MNPIVKRILPRHLSDKDRQYLAKGEHAGFNVWFEADGGPVVINCYGGLRDPKSHHDMYDADLSGRFTHTGRTHETASKPTYVNIHSNGVFDIWMIIRNDQLRLSSLFFEGKLIDIESSLDISGKPYQQHATQLRQAISYFVQLVDNPVSPRR